MGWSGGRNAGDLLAKLGCFLISLCAFCMLADTPLFATDSLLNLPLPTATLNHLESYSWNIHHLVQWEQFDNLLLVPRREIFSKPCHIHSDTSEA